MQAMESQFDVCTEDLFNQTVKLEEMQKVKFLLCEEETSCSRRTMRNKKKDWQKQLWSLLVLVCEQIKVLGKELNW